MQEKTNKQKTHIESFFSKEYTDTHVSALEHAQDRHMHTHTHIYTHTHTHTQRTRTDGQKY